MLHIMREMRITHHAQIEPRTAETFQPRAHDRTIARFAARVLVFDRAIRRYEAVFGVDRWSSLNTSRAEVEIYPPANFS